MAILQVSRLKLSKLSNFVCVSFANKKGSHYDYPYS